MVTREPVSVTTGAVVTSHGVVTLVLTASVLFAALVYICQSQTDSAPLTNQVELRIQSLRSRRAESCRNTEAQCRAAWQKPATLSFELNVMKNILSRRDECGSVLGLDALIGFDESQPICAEHI